MALRIEEFRIAPAARTPIFAIPQPPVPVRLGRAKSGKVKHPATCPRCKAKTGHKDGCAAYVESQQRLFQWGRYDRWMRAELGDEAFFKTDMSSLDMTRLPYPEPACLTCDKSNYPSHCTTVDYSRNSYTYGARPNIPPTAGHDFVPGPTPGLHPLSTNSIQYGPNTIFPPEPRTLRLSTSLLGSLSAATVAPRLDATTESEETVQS